MNKNIEILEQIGLTENEARVYLASLSLVDVTVLKLSKTTAIKRTTIYDIIESLKQKGLMSTYSKGIKILLKAENPEKLEATLEQRKKDLSLKLPELIKLYKNKTSVNEIVNFTGIEAMRQIYLDTLREIRTGEDYCVITNQEKWYSLDPDFALSYIEKRSKLDIKIKLLFQDSNTSQKHKKIELNYNEEVKILPVGTDLNIDTLILPDKVIIFELEAPYITHVFKSTNLINFHKEMFKIAWEKI